MNKDIYLLWPIEMKPNIRSYGPRKGKHYFRFGLGSRWIVKQDGSRRILAWSLFVGRYRLIFGRRTL